jgi:hypothetical protein
VPDLDAVDLVGYAASALVVFSLTMTSVVRLRAIGLLGSTTFLAYGLLLGSVPIVVTNLAVGAVHTWFLRQELGLKRDLGASRIDPTSPFLADFIDFHLDDIHRFQPDVTMPLPAECTFSLLLLRDGLPAGALVGCQRGEQLDVTLDYVMRAYRDSRLGRWLFGPGSRAFRDAGITRLVTAPGSDAHRAYLEDAGFVARDDRYVLDFGG